MKKKLTVIAIMGAFAILSVTIILMTTNKNINVYEDSKSKSSSLDREKEEEERLEKEKKDRELKEKEEKEKAIKEKLDKAEWLLYQDYNDKYEQTIKLCDEVLSEDNNNYRAYTVRGLAYAYLTVKDYSNREKALKDLDKALEIKNDYGYGRFNKGLAYAIFGELQEALVWYDKALEIEDYVWSYYGKAAIYGRLGDAENSAKFIKESINRKASIKELLKEEHDFDPVRDTDIFKNAIK